MRDAVPGAHRYECRRVGRCDVRMPGVQQHEGRRLRQIRTTIAFDAIEPIVAAILAPAELPHKEYPAVVTRSEPPFRKM
jgi:hypothetical protein